MWPFKRKAITATSPVVHALGRGWNAYPLLGGGARDRIQTVYSTALSANYAWMYTNSPAVRTVIDVLVRNIGQLELRLYEELAEDERQPRPDHAAALSMRYPSEGTSSAAFIRGLFKDFLIFDDAFALMAGMANDQVAFEKIPPQFMEVQSASLFRTDVYRFWPPDGRYVDFTPDQIFHWHGENPHDPRIGLSRLETLRNVIAEDAALQQALVELANAGLTEPIWVKRPLEAPEWSNDARKGFEEDLSNRLRRSSKMPVVLEEGMEMQGFGVSPRDAQMMEVRRWAISRIASAYGVPLGMVGEDDNLEEAQKQFYADTLPPYCEDFTKFLNQRLCVQIYRDTDLCFEFNLDEKHMGDDRVTALVSASGRAVMTTNEARAKLNLPPLDTGDELVTPLNVIVGENPKPSPQVMPPQKPGQPAQDGSYREEEPKALVKAEEYERVPQLLPQRKADLDRQFQHIDLSKAAIERHYGRLERSLRNKARMQDWNRWDREFADDLFSVVKQIVQTEGTIYAFKLAGTFAMEQVINYLRAMSEGAAKGINDKIREEIDDLGLEAALNKKAQHVESAGAGLGAGATTWAREEAARQSPFPESRVKVWVPDTQRHAQYGGQTVPLTADWPAGFAPGQAPNCRCTMSIV